MDVEDVLPSDSFQKIIECELTSLPLERLNSRMGANRYANYLSPRWTY
jgi:hypothetical protein